MNAFLRLPFSFAAAALLGIGCGPVAEDSQPQPEVSEEQKISAQLENLSPEWEAVRDALSKYRDPNVALADGYINFEHCDARADGAGMGVHFFNLALAGDLISDPYQPEVLLYVPDEAGSYSLVGVEYYQSDLGQPRPSVLDQPFDGPMDGHAPGQPVHYDLHAWLYRHNPDGLFAQYNPRVTCP